MADLAYIGPSGVGIKTPPGEPLGSAITLLERLLDQAKSGEIKAIAAAVVLEHGVDTTDFEFTFKGGSFGDLYIAVSQMHKRMLENAD